MPETHAAPTRGHWYAGLLATAALAFLLLAPTAHARAGAVVWAAPTQADRSQFAVTTGSKLTLRLKASTSTPLSDVRIKPVGVLPSGAVLDLTPGGKVSHALFRWTPSKAGRYMLRFAASSGKGGAAPTLTYLVEVKAKVQYPQSVTLTNARIAYQATVRRAVTVHTRPREWSPVMTMFPTKTPEGTRNLVLVLSSLKQSATETWYRVRLQILPNNSVGWVSARDLGELVPVHTHLYVDRAKLTATLKRNGQTIFTTIVGVGRDYWPTPAGEFYILDKISGFDNPVYGPVAFGTSARSATLTDWPGGGFVAVHGTNEPQILPGHVSHGCIRMPNESILKLARLMQPGTPLTVR